MSGALSAVPGPILTPAATQVALQSNFRGNLDFTFANQYLPDLAEKEFNKYGKQSISGFLDLNGSMFPFESDLVKWSEAGRMHIGYQDISIISYGAGNDTATLQVNDAGVTECNIRQFETVLLSSKTDVTKSDRALVTSVTGLQFTVAYYGNAGGTIGASDTARVFVTGSEFSKGSDGMLTSIEATTEIYENRPIIIRDMYQVNGSDMAQIGWIDAIGADGEMLGYFWYLKSEAWTRARFDDKLEMSLIEGVEAGATSGVAALTGQFGKQGTLGMFAAIEDDGNIWAGGNPTALVDWDTVLQRLDKQGSIEMNSVYVNRQFGLDTTNMLASVSTGSFTGLSYGMFPNGEEMALNLNFSGFKRAGYEFYQTPWRYLNDPLLRGGMLGGKINGVMIPSGNTQIKDLINGGIDSKPYLHQRYRQSPTEDRRYKSWVTGSAGGVHTDTSDSMKVSFLSERLLCALGRNNFMLFRGY